MSSLRKYVVHHPTVDDMGKPMVLELELMASNETLARSRAMYSCMAAGHFNPESGTLPADALKQFSVVDIEGVT